MPSPCPCELPHRESPGTTTQPAQTSIVTLSNDTDKDITEVGFKVDGPDQETNIPYWGPPGDSFPAHSTKQISLPSSKVPTSIEIGVIVYSDATAYVVSKRQFNAILRQRQAILQAAKLAKKTLEESVSYLEAGSELERLAKVYDAQHPQHLTHSDDDTMKIMIGEALKRYVSAFEQNTTRQQFEKLIDDDIAFWTKHSQLTAVQP